MKNAMKKLTAIAMGLLLAVTMVGCNTAAPSESAPDSSSAAPSESQSTDTSESEAPAEAAELLDRAGMPYEVPASAEKIISLSPAATEILIGLGLEANIVGIDNYSVDAFENQDATASMELFDLMAPSAEQAVALEADIIISSGLSYYEGGNPMAVAAEHGTFVTDIPTASTIEGIRGDILFIGSITGKDAEAAALVADMDARIQAVVDTIGDSASGESVYFEIGSAPALYSLGSGTFINEFIELVGCTNALGDQEGWLSVSEETVVAANPAVIFTNEGYIDAPVDALKARAGWDVVSAVSEDRVFFISANASSRTSQNIVIALEEMATAIYPDLFA